MSVNRARGEVAAALGGHLRRLCLTLQALAEIEAALDVEGWAELSDRLRRLSPRDLAPVLGALLRGGGGDPADALDATPGEAAAAIAATFAAALS